MCRAYLSLYYEKGELVEQENDKPIFTKRYNGGAVSVNLPMILQKSLVEHKDFYEVLDYYLDMINGIHIKTYNFLCKLKASCNPVALCQGGLGNLKPTDTIEPLIRRITFSYGYTALNELQELYNGKSLYEERNNPNCFAYEVEKYIADYVEQRKKERIAGTLPYIAAIYGTPKQTWVA